MGVAIKWEKLWCSAHNSKFSLGFDLIADHKKLDNPDQQKVLFFWLPI